MSESLFRRATRYVGPENRLTQILAATLEHLPEVALALARAWTSPTDAAPGEIPYPSTDQAHRALAPLQLQSVRTQVRTVSGRLVDLALRFGPAHQPSADDVVVWVEIKLGTDPHDQQVASYVADMPNNVKASVVVLLAPRASLPYAAEDVPEGVPQRSWQATGGRLGKAAADIHEPVDSFLLKELMAYMREDNLIDPHAVGPELLMALAYADQAEAALLRVCEEVSRFVAREHGKPADRFAEARHTRKYGWNYWEAWNLRKNGSDEALLWLDWNARNDAAQPEAEGRSLIFMSGLAAYRYEELAPTPDDHLRHERLKAGVRVDGQLMRFEPVSDDCERLTRIAFPEEVLVGRTLEDQAASLGAWIVAGFHALTLPLDRLPAA